MLTYAGYPMLIDADGEAGAFASRYVSHKLYCPWRRPSFPGYGTLQMTYPTRMYLEPEVVVNRLHWPCCDMSRWGFIHLLCNSDTVDALIPLSCIEGAYQPLPLVIGNPETGGETITITSMFMLPPTPLSGIRGLSQDQTDNQSLYLVTLVDLRYFLWFVDTGDIVTDADLLGGVSNQELLFLEWDFLIGQCISRAGDSGISLFLNRDNFSPNYLQMSTQMFALEYEPIPPVLDAYAFNLGMRWTAPFYAGPTGTYLAMLYGTALSVYQGDASQNPGRAILAGGFRYNDPI